MDESQELHIPLPKNNFTATEVVRAWADKKAYIALRKDVWADYAMWGILLVDIARHVANAHKSDKHSAESILSRIKQGFDAEWDTPRETKGQVEP